MLRNCVSFETQYPWKETNVECRHDEEVFHRVMVGKQSKGKIFVSWALAQPANCFSTTDVRIQMPFSFTISCSVHLRKRLNGISICRPSIAACSVYRRTLCVQPRSVPRILISLPGREPSAPRCTLPCMTSKPLDISSHSRDSTSITVATLLSWSRVSSGRNPMNQFLCAFPDAAKHTS